MTKLPWSWYYNKQNIFYSWVADRPESGCSPWEVRWTALPLGNEFWSPGPIRSTLSRGRPGSGHPRPWAT